MAEKKKGVKGKITQTAEQTAAVLPPVETAANGESAVEAEVKPVRKRKSAAAWEEKPAEIKEESSAAGEDTVPQIPEEDKKQTADAEIKEEKPGKKRAKKTAAPKAAAEEKPSGQPREAEKPAEEETAVTSETPDTATAETPGMAYAEPETAQAGKPGKKRGRFGRKKKEVKHFDYPLERIEADPGEGLSEAQAQERMDRGLNNEQPNIVTKSYLNIFRSNVITLFNGLNFLLAALILVYGSIKNMTFIILVICNMVVGIVQEIRSKLVLEKMSLLNVPKVSVIRGGEKKHVDMSDIVIDDIIEIHAGEQIASDSVVVSGECEVNESMLTGEQDDIHKTAGAELLSGSVVQSGTCRARVVKVGKDNFAATILSEAKKYKKSKSQLMRSINWIIRIVTIAIFPMGILMYLTNCADRGIGYLDMFNITSSEMAEKVSSVITNSVASMVGMIPEGLVMMTSIALAVGVIKLARKQTLVQDLYSIETLARVDMLCLDKTGTITEGSMQVERIHQYTDKYGSVTDIMTSMVAALGASGSTFEAFADYFKGETAWSHVATVPFSSSRKWSGADFGDKGRFIVGAPEFVLKERYLLVQKDVENYTAQGYRVLLLVYSPQPIKENVREDKLKSVALIILSDKIRASANSTLKYFAEQGVEIKIISGDNPITVSKVAERAGVKNYDSYIDATTLKTEEEVFAACDKYTIFGRVTPKQKKILVQGLKAKGHTVGMTGDGVNDVMALKEADCSIAMASGSEAARNVAQLVLMNSDFASLPSVVLEGRRVINNIERVASLFLVKTTFSTLLTLMCIILQMSYPFVPIQLTLISALFVGIPSFFLALEPNGRKVEGNFLSKVFSKALPAGMTITLMVTIACVLYRDIGLDVSAQIATMAFFITALSSLIVLLQACYPYTKLRLLIIGLAVVVLIFAVSVDWTREFFSITSLTSDMLRNLIIMMVCVPPCILFMRAEVGAIRELYRTIKKFFINVYTWIKNTANKFIGSIKKNK